METTMPITITLTEEQQEIFEQLFVTLSDTKRYITPTVQSLVENKFDKMTKTLEEQLAVKKVTEFKKTFKILAAQHASKRHIISTGFILGLSALDICRATGYLLSECAPAATAHNIKQETQQETEVEMAEIL